MQPGTLLLKSRRALFQPLSMGNGCTFQTLPSCSDVLPLGHTPYATLEVAVPSAGEQGLAPCCGTMQLAGLCVLMEGKVFSHCCSHGAFPPT